METNPKYRGRIRAAWWSKTILAIASVLSALILPFGFDVESALIVAAILILTYFEFRVYGYFSQGDARGPGLGFRNQSFFAAGILAYGLYHAIMPVEIPQELRSVLDEPTLEQIVNTIKYGYLTVGVLGGISQFGLAYYYWKAKSTPPPVLTN